MCRISVLLAGLVLVLLCAGLRARAFSPGLRRFKRSGEPCTSTSGVCSIARDANETRGIPRCTCGRTSTTYSCEPNDILDYEVHVLAQYEPLGGVRTFRSDPKVVGDVQVDVNRLLGTTDRPVKLVLTSYEAANWRINASGIDIDDILVASYYHNFSSVEIQASGSSGNTPVLKERYYDGYGNSESRQTRLISYVRGHFGLVTSFTGTYRTDRWELTVGVDNACDDPDLTEDSALEPPVEIEEDGAVRLSHPDTGKVGYINYRRSNDNQINAALICQLAGLSETGTGLKLTKVDESGVGVPVVLMALNCSTTATTLSDCTTEYKNRRRSTTVLGVSCSPIVSEPSVVVEPDGAVKVTNPETGNEGYIKYNGENSRDINADLICQITGLGNSGTTLKLPREGADGEGVSVVLWKFRCTSSSAKLSDCVTDGYKSRRRSKEILGVTCSTTGLIVEDCLASSECWLRYNFTYDDSWNNCHGDQYVTRTKYTNGKYVGVNLCKSGGRYKLFMSNSLDGVFENIADGKGHGQDHCELVGGTEEDAVLDGHFWESPAAMGFTRHNWGEEFTRRSIGFGPPWTGQYFGRYYECGVDIPGDKRVVIAPADLQPPTDAP